MVHSNGDDPCLSTDPTFIVFSPSCIKGVVWREENAASLRTPIVPCILDKVTGDAVKGTVMVMNVLIQECRAAEVVVMQASAGGWHRHVVESVVSPAHSSQALLDCLKTAHMLA